MDEEENITYCLDENYEDNSNETDEDFAILLSEFESMNADAENFYSDDEAMSEIKNYELNYTNKQLLIICDYYGLTKQTKIRSLKKNELIALIMVFEKNIENMETVIKRKELWFYLDELKADKIMKKFVLW
jgi:hypothetical protein